MSRRKATLTDLLDALDAPDFAAVGLCAEIDPEMFFPEKGQMDLAREARAICAKCDVREACAEYAIQCGEQGIWGGTTERERRRIRAERAGRAA